MLTEKQKQAAALMFNWNLTTTQVAEQVGVSRVTVWKWTKKKEFTRELERLERAYAREQARERRRKLRPIKMRLTSRLWRLKRKFDAASQKGNASKAYALYEKTALAYQFQAEREMLEVLGCGTGEDS